jgi:hypothetical protein
LRVLVQARERSLIRFSSNSGLSLLALLVAVLLIPTSGWANTSKNCPVEPAQAAIVSGETYIGTNCVLNTVSDQDLFTFNATAGDTWAIVAEAANVVYPNQICFTLHDPKGSSVVSACSLSGVGTFFASTTIPLTVMGTYTIDLSEMQTAVVDYGISLERVSPAPADAIGLTLGKTVSGQVNTPSAQEAYSFYGTTTGTYQVTATMTSGAYPQNLCFTAYRPGGAAVVGACTLSGVGQTTIQANVSPAVNGTYVIIVDTQANDDTLSFDLNVTCVSAPGTCGTPPPPSCVLKDAPSYDAASGTLTMNFTLGTKVAVTWNGWLTSQNTMQSLWSVSRPITEPAISVTKTHSNVAKSGKVGILSTLTTPTGGITCSSWALVNTGTP